MNAEELFLYKRLFLQIGLPLAFLAVLLQLYRRLRVSENEKKYLKSQIISLLNKYSNRDSILANYIYDTKLGIYKHKMDGLYYCHKCLIEKTNESPLQTKKDGWHCPVCDSFYEDPDRKLLQEE